MKEREVIPSRDLLSLLHDKLEDEVRSVLGTTLGEQGNDLSIWTWGSLVGAT